MIFSEPVTWLRSVSLSSGCCMVRPFIGTLERLLIKMIALDLDGTLAVENHQVLPATRVALEALHVDGVEVVIATGRRYRTTRYVIENLGFDVCAVCNGGALVKAPQQETLHADQLDVDPVLGFARSVGLTLFAFLEADNLGGPDFVIDGHTRWNELTQTYFANNRQWAESSDVLAGEARYLTAGIFDTRAKLSHFAEEIARLFPGCYNTIVMPHLDSGYYYCEISAYHTNKWHGLTKLHEHLGVTAAQTCAVGDQLNDMAMVQAAGVGVAMGNAHAELKKVARFTCGDHVNNGILEVVRYIRDTNAG